MPSSSSGSAQPAQRSTQKAPVCPVERECGACQHVGVPYAQQLASKDTRVAELFADVADASALRPILGMDELSEEDRMTVLRARKLQRFLAQPTHVAEKFTGIPGIYVPLKDTLESFRAIVDGEADQYPEAAFYNVGTLADVAEKARRLEAEGR